MGESNERIFMERENKKKATVVWNKRKGKIVTEKREKEKKERAVHFSIFLLLFVSAYIWPRSSYEDHKKKSPFLLKWSPV